MEDQDFVAVRMESLSTPDDVRYVILNRVTREVVDDAMGRGYKSAQAAHKSFSYKQKLRGNSPTRSVRRKK